MAEIKINVSEINNAIAQLQSLKTEIDSCPAAPEIVGGGKTINELEDILQLYLDFNADLSGLVSNTIAFFQNVRDSYIESDEMAARMIAGENK